MNNLIEEIKLEVKENWSNNRTPLLLSTIGPKFIKLKEDNNFKGVTKWIKENLDKLESEIYQDNERPAYIGLIPAGEKFEKNNVSKEFFSSKNKVIKNNSVDRKKIVFGFIEILSNLSDLDKERVVLPVDVLAKMIKGN